MMCVCVWCRWSQCRWCRWCRRCKGCRRCYADEVKSWLGQQFFGKIPSELRRSFRENTQSVKVKHEELPRPKSCDAYASPKLFRLQRMNEYCKRCQGSNVSSWSVQNWDTKRVRLSRLSPDMEIPEDRLLKTLLLNNWIKSHLMISWCVSCDLCSPLLAPFNIPVIVV